MTSFFLRLLAVLCFLFREGLWILLGKNTSQFSPKSKHRSFRSTLSIFFTYCIDVFILLQLFGIRVFPIQPFSHLLQGTGVLLICAGTILCSIARMQLGANWVLGADYQIKKNQSLVTTGVYQWIRHPIYSGAALSYIGGELTAGSYLFIPFILFYIVFYLQAKREEKLLINHFGTLYIHYRKNTYFFIPYLF